MFGVVKQGPGLAAVAAALSALYACQVLDDVVARRENASIAGGGQGGSTDPAAGAGAGGAGAAGEAGSAGQAQGFPCALPGEPAFCDPLQEPAPGGSAGDLDETRWKVSRRTQAIDTTGGPFVGWRPFEVLDCDGAPVTIEPGNDFAICPSGSRSGLRDSLYAGPAGWNTTAQRSISPYQPFDFKDRTGTIAFDLASPEPAAIEPFWHFEVWLTGAPLSGISGNMNQFPPNALELLFTNEACGAGQVGVSAFAANEDTYMPLGSEGRPCFDFRSAESVHFEIRVAQSQVEVLVSDPGGSELSRVGLFPADLSFSRGYLHLGHVCSSSDGMTVTDPGHVHELRWANVGFDGPVRPQGRTYWVADALAPWTSIWAPGPDNPQNAEGWVSMGYRVQQVDPMPLTIVDVDPNGTRAWLAIDLFPAGSPVSFRLNGGGWQNFNTYPPLYGGPWGSYAVPISPTLLVEGDNTVEFLTQGSDLAIANINVHVE